MPQNRLFFALASRSGFGATISDAVARSSIVFCNSVSADRIVMAVSRLLRAVALECEGSSGKCEVWSVKEAVEKCEVWSVKFKFGVRSAQCEVWGLECEGSSGKCEVWSAKCEVWSVECEVSSSECEECSVKCGVWRLCFVSRWKNQTVVEGRTRSGQGVFEL